MTYPATDVRGWESKRSSLPSNGDRTCRTRALSAPQAAASETTRLSLPLSCRRTATGVRCGVLVIAVQQEPVFGTDGGCEVFRKPVHPAFRAPPCAQQDRTSLRQVLLELANAVPSARKRNPRIAANALMSTLFEFMFESLSTAQALMTPAPRSIQIKD